MRALVLLALLLPSNAAAETGAQLWQTLQCGACHSRDGSRRAGPPLTTTGEAELADGTRVTRDEAYLRESILRPSAKLVKGFPPVMPAYEGRITEEQLQALLAFLRAP